MDSYTNVSSESDEWASSTAHAILAAKISALDAKPSRDDFFFFARLDRATLSELFLIFKLLAPLATATVGTAETVSVSTVMFRFDQVDDEDAPARGILGVEDEDGRPVVACSGGGRTVSVVLVFSTVPAGSAVGCECCPATDGSGESTSIAILAMLLLLLFSAAPLVARAVFGPSTSSSLTVEVDDCFL